MKNLSRKPTKTLHTRKVVKSQKEVVKKLSEYVDIKGLEMVKELKKHILKNWGKQCREYQYGCSVCDLWHCINVMETIFI